MLFLYYGMLVIPRETTPCIKPPYRYIIKDELDCTVRLMNVEVFVICSLVDTQIVTATRNMPEFILFVIAWPIFC